MKSALLYAAALATVHGLKLEAEQDVDQANFNAWANREGQSFKNATERAARFENWQKKDKEYKAINSDPKNTFTVGHNKFSALTEEEFKSFLDGPEFQEHFEDSHGMLFAQARPKPIATCGA